MGTELIVDGLKLLVMGMGTVFVFLVLMIVMMNLLQKAVEPFKHLLEPPVAPARNKAAAKGDDAGIAAAAAASVHFKRNNQ